MRALILQVVTGQEAQEIAAWLAIFAGLYLAGRAGISLIFYERENKK